MTTIELARIDAATGQIADLLVFRRLRPDFRRMEPKVTQSRKKDGKTSRKKGTTVSGAERLKNPDRRKAMKKLGKYAAYTAPVMLTLLMPKKSPAQNISYHR